MQSDWPQVLLGDHCTKIGSGATPRGGSSVYLDTGETRLIRSQNIYNDRFNPSGLVFIDDNAASSLSNVCVEKNDVLLNITGDSVARVCLAEKEFLPARVNQHVAIIRPFPDSFDPRYLRYLLASPTMQSHLLSLAAGGATRNALTKGMIESLELVKPPLQTQIRIATEIEALDKKIKINNQLNQTLESIAQAIFKSWFVEFDPVIDNALAAGNAIPEPFQDRAERRKQRLYEGQSDLKPMPTEVRRLFPDAFVETKELGWVPEGWQITPISNLCSNVQNGGTPRRDNPNYWKNGAIPWLTSGEVRRNIILETEQFISEEGLHGSSAKWLPSGSTVVAMYGATAGQVSFSASNLTTNQAICGLVPKEPYKYYNYLFLSRNVDALGHQARGSAQQNISKGIIENTLTTLVPGNIANIFQTTCDPIFCRWIQALKETSTLDNIRDTLLPKLISGELRIPEAEALIDEVEA